MNRRKFAIGLAGLGALAGAGGIYRHVSPMGEAMAGEFEISLTNAEWRRKLSEDEYRVLREMATERAFTSDLLDEKRDGIYTCAGCALELYSSETKFDSGTGWPSFYEALPNAVGTQTDYKLILPRTEVHCRRCGGHLGHIFNDGPPPTGKRHCINGIALDFMPKTA